MRAPSFFHRKSAAGIGLILVVLALHGWFANGGQTAESRRPPAPAQEKAPTDDEVLAARQTRDRDSTQVGSGPSNSASAFTRLQRATSAQRLEAELIELARAGDTTALAAMMDLLARCGTFYPDRGATSHPRHELAGIAPGSRDRKTREFALGLQESFCDRPYAPGETAELRAEFRAMLDAAAGSGDPVARAWNGFSGEGEDQILAALHETDEPWVAERALAAFSLSNGAAARRIDEQVFPSDLLLPAERQQRLLIKQMAARWHACSLGAACGPNQHHELGECVYRGNCGIGLSVQAFIQQRVLSSWQFELMQRYLAEIRALHGGG